MLMLLDMFSYETVLAYFVITYGVALLLWRKNRDISESKEHRAKFAPQRFLVLLLVPVLLPLFLLVALVLYPPHLVKTLTYKVAKWRRQAKLRQELPFAEQTLRELAENNNLPELSVLAQAVITVEQAQIHLSTPITGICALRCKLISRDGKLVLDEGEDWSLQQTLGIDGERDPPILYRKIGPVPSRHEWVAVFTAQFKKAIQKHDKKIQGRILDAIIDILEAPNVTRGDTVKPLTADFSTKWRYRIGDFRLVYVPVAAQSQVIFVDFDARGAVYE